jgi:hypothetical protein
MRQDHEMPEATGKWGWKYHHLGVPTDVAFPDERYIPQFRLYVTGFSTSPFGIEWMRYEADSPVHKLVQTVPHLAFEVPNLEHELSKGEFKILIAPNPPSDGVRAAFIEHNGCPIELIEFEKNKSCARHE